MPDERNPPLRSQEQRRVDRISVRRPPLLATGAHIRVVSPSWPSMFYAPQRAARAEQALRDLGFRVSYGQYAHEVTDDGMSAGTPQQRAADFMAAIMDPDVDAILAAGGGGTTRELLPYLDCNTIRRCPKPFIGHCENIWLNYYLLHHADLASYYGAAFMMHFGEVGGVFQETAAGFVKAVSEAQPISYTPVPDRTNEFFGWTDPAVEATPRKRSVPGGWDWISPGRGSGRFVGGEARYLTRILDEYHSDLADVILFWHVMPNNQAPVGDLLRDLAERADMRALSGMVVGTDVRHAPDEWAAIVKRAIDQIIGDVEYPIMVNADIGHTDPVWLLPYGLTAVLDSENGLYFSEDPQSKAKWHALSVRAAVSEQMSRAAPGAVFTGPENFFRQGGDSVGVARVISGLKGCGLKLSARDFMADPTLDGVAETVLRNLTASDQA